MMSKSPLKRRCQKNRVETLVRKEPYKSVARNRGKKLLPKKTVFYCSLTNYPTKMPPKSPLIKWHEKKVPN